MKAYAPISLLLQLNAGPRWATSPPVAKALQPRRPPAGAPSAPGASIGCSGQTPVSMSPTMTLLPAFAEPPRVGQTVVAPMNDVLSSSGCSSVSSWTAAMPSVLSRAPIWFAGTTASTPPNADA